MSLSRITGQSTYAAEQADACRRLADNTNYSEVARRDFKDMEMRWLQLAQSWDQAEMISGYLEWQSRGLAPPNDFE